MPEKILLAIEAMSNVDEMAAAADKHGYHLRVLAEDATYYGETKAEVVAFPTRDQAELVAYIEANRAAIAQVFSVTDTWGVIASEIRDKFGFHQFGDTEKLKFFRDKDAVESVLIAHGFAEPSHSWPKVLKLRNGTGKIGVYFAESEHEANEIVKMSGYKRDEFVVQDFYFGPAYSAEVWRDSQHEVFFGITNRILSDPPYFTERVKSFPWAANSRWETEARDWVFHILRILDYALGLVHIEFIETSDGFRLVEINARMAGALITPGILATTNFNPYAMAVHQALDVPPCEIMDREIRGGYSHVSLYASSTGTVASIRGIDQLVHNPGAPTWVPSREIGDSIVEIGTYRSRIGNLMATGETAAIAQDRAISASRSISVQIATRRIAHV
ncbi:MAG: ATP-grasp domain-containing protein [Arcanobacterium sp.]|nr:ATP-grasp domain-containing protein [Arcanobacterium sp.]